jgi:hypothetical protein
MGHGHAWSDHPRLLATSGSPVAAMNEEQTILFVRDCRLLHVERWQAAKLPILDVMSTQRCRERWLCRTYSFKP